MIETSNGTALRVFPDSLQVLDNPGKILPLGAGAAVKLSGVAREGGIGNNQKTLLPSVKWVAKNGKKITISTPDSNGLFYVSVDGVRINTQTGGPVLVSASKAQGDVIDQNGFFYVKQSPTGGFDVFSNDGTLWKNISGTNAPHLARYAYHPAGWTPSALFYTQDTNFYKLSTPLGTPHNFGVYGQYAFAHVATTTEAAWCLVEVGIGSSVAIVRQMSLSGLTLTQNYVSSKLNSLTLPVNDNGTVNLIYYDGTTGVGLIQQPIASGAPTLTTLLAGTGTFTRHRFGYGAGYHSIGTSIRYVNTAPARVTYNSGIAQNDQGEMDGGFKMAAPTTAGGRMSVLYSNGGSPYSGYSSIPIGLSLAPNSDYALGRLVGDYGDYLAFTGSTYIVSQEPSVRPGETAGSSLISYLNQKGEIVSLSTQLASVDNLIFENISPSRVLIRNLFNAFCVIDTESVSLLRDTSALVYPAIVQALTPPGSPVSYRSYSDISEGRTYEMTGWTYFAYPYLRDCDYCVYNSSVNTSRFLSYNGLAALTANPDQGLANITVTSLPFPPTTHPLGFLYSGSAIPAPGVIYYQIENQYPAFYDFFLILGQQYAFDGENIYLVNLTGGGISQGLNKVAPADGLRFITAADDVAYFYSKYGNALYTFDGGRQVLKLADMPQVGDLSGTYARGAFQTSSRALFLPITGNSILRFMDGRFTKIDLPESTSGSYINLVETTDGMAILNGPTLTPTNGRLVVYPSVSSSPAVDILDWKTGFMGLGENQKIAVQDIVFTLAVKNAAVTPKNLTLTFDYHTDVGSGTATTTHAVDSSRVSGGIYRFTYKPGVTAVLGFSAGLSTVGTDLDVVILDCTVYYTVDGPAIYGPLNIVNGG